jgi:hypothetical protein
MRDEVPKNQKHKMQKKHPSWDVPLIICFLIWPITLHAESEKPAHSCFILSPDGVRLTVEAAEAHYPITIDPLAQQAYLKASNTGAGDLFGDSVAISGDTLVVGAAFEASSAKQINGDQTDNSAANAGAAYVFVREEDGWKQQAYLKASNSEAGDLFGISVAISGDTVVIGASAEDSNATGVNGKQGDNSAQDAGAAYVFVRNGATWSQQAYLKASNSEASDSFGLVVTISDDTVVVAAPFEDSSATGVDGDQTDNSAGESGAAYVFTRSGTTWSQQAYLKASNTEAGDAFGNAVAMSGDTLAVGAPTEDSNATGGDGDQTNNSAINSGAAYVFTRNGVTWSQQVYLKASNTEADDFFGLSVAISGDTMAAGAALEDSNANGVGGDQTDNTAIDSGAAYVFIRDDTTWSQQAYVKASNSAAGDRFGFSAAVLTDTLAIGADLEDSNATGLNGDQSDNSAVDSGAVYLFVRSDSTWSPQTYLKASNTEGDDRFGFSLALSDTTLVIGAIFEDSNATGVNGDQAQNSLVNSGAAYIFTEPPPALPTTLGNISTRLRVETGDNVLIGGFIITGAGPKKVLMRAIGPSLPLSGVLANPTLELHDDMGTLLVSNDNWKDAPNKQEIIDTTIAPTNDLESAILMTLDPGAYTAIVRGVNDATGIGLIEAYDLESTTDSQLANISTRGRVQTGDNVMIGGFIILGDEAQEVIVRAIGPSLPLAGKLANPVLELHDKDGATIATNDDWRSDQETQIIDTGLPPNDDLESAIFALLAPDAYTAIVRGVNGTTGIGLVEVYALTP